MLPDLPEAQSSIYSIGIFQCAGKHGKKQQTMLCEDIDNMETGEEAGHGLTFAPQLSLEMD